MRTQQRHGGASSNPTPVSSHLRHPPPNQKALPFKNSCSKPKAIRGIKSRRIELTPPHWTNTLNRTTSKPTRLKGKQAKHKSDHISPSTCTTVTGPIAEIAYDGNNHTHRQDDSNSLDMNQPNLTNNNNNNRNNNNTAKSSTY